MLIIPLVAIGSILITRGIVSLTELKVNKEAPKYKELNKKRNNFIYAFNGIPAIWFLLLVGISSIFNLMLEQIEGVSVLVNSLILYIISIRYGLSLRYKRRIVIILACMACVLYPLLWIIVYIWFLGRTHKLIKIATKGIKMKPSREDWSTTSLYISKGLEKLRRKWFDLCVKTLQESSSEKGKDSLDIEVVNIRLGADADLAIKAYQLYLVSGFLAKHAYISLSEGKDFADILWAQVCGTQIEECLAFFSRYHEVQSDGGTQLFRFSSDVAKYITGNEAPLFESMLIGQTVGALVGSVHILVASCFGDEKTVKKLESKFTRG
ncbi:MAG: hypothetical protein HWN66_13845 [Candidatus Helarchaeota archaeon]|nr:hypothetical protein [Candidatus Helarchaeota archaeon]